jgi:pimeloyl-ACP methyl ester carboxylesterase
LRVLPRCPGAECQGITAPTYQISFEKCDWLNAVQAISKAAEQILRPPRLLAEKMYADILRWSKVPKGGHFAALEQPELLAQEVREFFRPLR